MGNGIKPTNFGSGKGITPVSSNNVIWQGPDLPCIKLCKGDSISKVIYEMACKLCALIDMFELDNYTLDCLALDKCDVPKDFVQLIQLLINKICEILGMAPSEQAQAACDCDIAIAGCFQASLGMSNKLLNYVAAIGEKVCEQEVILQNQQLAIEQILERLDTL